MREVLSARGLVENQRGSRCEWVLGFARTTVMQAGEGGAQCAWTWRKNANSFYTL